MLLLNKYIQNRQAFFGYSEFEWVKFLSYQRAASSAIHAL